MKIRCLISALVCLLFCFDSPLTAQSSNDNRSIGSTISDDAATFFSDAGSIFSSPLHWDQSDILNAHFMIGGTIVSFALDDPARNLAKRNQSQFGDGLFTFGREYGRELYGLGLGGGLYLGGLFFRSNDVRESGMMLVESIAFSGAITTVVKSLAGRARPYTNEGTIRFHGFTLDESRLSLPSGHVTVAFAVSSTLAARFKKPLASIALYSLAAVTAASRAYTDDHWFSDTFLAAAIGTTVGMSVVRMHEKEEEGTSLRVMPTLNGITLVWMLR